MPEAKSKPAQNDRLLSTTRVAELLGLEHQNDVRSLIHQGKLAAKKQIVRGEGKRPRMFVLQSEVDRYIASLADVTGSVVHHGKPTRLSRRQRRDSGVIEFV